MGVGVHVMGAGRRPDGARDAAVGGAVPARATLILYAVCCFAVLAVLAVDGPLRWPEIALSLLLQAVVGLMLLADLRITPDGSQRMRIMGICGVGAYLIAVSLLRDGSGASASSGFGPLVLLPVAWASPRARRTELGVAVVGAAVVYLALTLIIGAPSYPASGLSTGALFLVISGGLGITVIQESILAAADALFTRRSARGATRPRWRVGAAQAGRDAYLTCQRPAVSDRRS